MSQSKTLIRICANYIVQSVMTLIVCILIGAVMMILAYHIPVNEEYKVNAEVIMDEQNTSADYPLIHAWEQYFTSYRPGVFDGGSTIIIVRNCYRDVQLCQRVYDAQLFKILARLCGVVASTFIFY